MRFNSIRARLLLWLFVPLSLLASLVSVDAYYAMRRTSDELHDRTLQTVWLTLSEHMLANDNELVAENLLEVLTESLGDQFFYHFAAPGNAWLIGYSGKPVRPPGVEPSGSRAVFYDGTYQGDPVRAIAARRFVSIRDIDGWTTLTVWQRTQQRRALALDLFLESILRLGLLVGAAGLIAWWAVSRGLRPLDDLREAVERRSPDDLSPIRRRVSAELKPIVHAMNALFARVSETGKGRERLIGDATHQLRNPVAALRTQAQNILAADTIDDTRHRAETLVESTERLGRLVDQMLLSARSNAGPIPLSDHVDLFELGAEVAREHATAVIARRQDLSFEREGDAAVVRGNAGLLKEALANLVDNAIVHNVPGTAIVVSVESDASRSTVRVSLSDSGEPLDDARLSELMAPFRTGDGAAAGSGLGLSIVADIVRLHNGRLSVSAREGGSGKTLTVTLPGTNRQAVQD